jgi:hypothetical protein
MRLANSILQSAFDELTRRAERAEARVKELEGALRNLLFIFQTAQGKAIGAAERVLRGEGGE